MTSRRISCALGAIGLAALLLALGWWWVVFRALIGNGSLSIPAAIPCMAGNSDLCTLAQALCTDQHWYGIRHYDTGLFWAGAMATGAAIVLALRGRRNFERPAT